MVMPSCISAPSRRRRRGSGACCRSSRRASGRTGRNRTALTPDLRQRLDVAREVGRAAGEQPALAIDAALRLRLRVRRHAIGQPNRRGIASRLLDHAAQLARRPPCSGSACPSGIAGWCRSDTTHRHIARYGAAPDCSRRRPRSGSASAPASAVNTTLVNFAYLPSKRGSSCSHSSLHAIMYSSVTAPRSSNGGVPTASNSSFIQPAPMPSVRRPFDSTSSVASIFAVSTAGRCGTTITEVTIRNFDVCAAMNIAVVSCSWRSTRAPETNAPLSEYG